MIKEFIEFLKEFKVISLAVAFVMGIASTNLITAFVKDIFMPLLSPILSNGSWQTASLKLGSIVIAYGAFLADFLNFIILAAVVFVVVKKVMKAEEAEKK
jgi:large conductance mechanosensitive channel